MFSFVIRDIIEFTNIVREADARLCLPSGEKSTHKDFAHKDFGRLARRPVCIITYTLWGHLARRPTKSLCLCMCLFSPYSLCADMRISFLVQVCSYHTAPPHCGHFGERIISFEGHLVLVPMGLGLGQRMPVSPLRTL